MFELKKKKYVAAFSQVTELFKNNKNIQISFGFESLFQALIFLVIKKRNLNSPDTLAIPEPLKNYLPECQINQEADEIQLNEKEDVKTIYFLLVFSSLLCFEFLL